MGREWIRRVIFDGFCFAYLIGVPVVLYHRDYFDQSFEVLPVLGFSAILIIAGSLLGIILNRVGLKTLGEHIFEPPHKRVMKTEDIWYRTFWGIEFLVLFVLTCSLGYFLTGFSFRELLDEDGFAGAQRMFSALFDPNFAVLPKAIVSIVETIFIAFMSTILAIPIAFILSFLCAKNIMSENISLFSFYAILRTVLNITRSVEPLIWAIIFSVWVGIGPFAGMLALMIHSIASLAKQYSEIVECVEEGPIEAIRATGARPLQVIWYSIVPQIVLPYISFTIYRWDINVRMATIIGLVGGGGIGTLLIQYQGQAMWHEVGCIILVIAIVVWFMDTASAYIREAIK